MSTEIKVAKPHSVEMSGRKKANVTGVNEVVAASDNTVSLNTSAGGLTFTGKAMCFCSPQAWACCAD